MGRMPLLAWLGVFAACAALTGCECTGACCGRRSRSFTEGPPPAGRDTNHLPPQGWANQPRNTTGTPNTTATAGVISTTNPGAAPAAMTTGQFKPTGFADGQAGAQAPTADTMPVRSTVMPLPLPTRLTDREPIQTDDGPKPPDAPGMVPPFPATIHQVPASDRKPIATSEDKRTPTTVTSEKQEMREEKPIAVSGQDRNKVVMPEGPPIKFETDPPPVLPPSTPPTLPSKPAADDSPVFPMPVVDPAPPSVPDLPVPEKK